MIELTCRPPGLRATTIRIGTGPAVDLARIADDRLPDRMTHAIVDRRVAIGFPGASLGAGRCTYVDAGEELKTLASLEHLLSSLVRAGLDRRSVVVAVGGGSVGDAGGLAAALLLRGVSLVMVPTTLLSMVDSSVGGKTAINLTEGKNLAGTLWPAAEVWIDPAFVATLPEAEWSSGLGEVVKTAIGLDAELFELLEAHAHALLVRDLDVVSRTIALALRAKIRIVETDPTERGERRRLNLGHTLGHALESHSGYSLPHGIAVARGIHHALDLAVSRGLLAADDAARSRALLERLGFGVTALPSSRDLRSYLLRDKKIESGVLRAVLPTGIGQSRVVETTADAFLESLSDR